MLQEKVIPPWTRSRLDDSLLRRFKRDAEVAHRVLDKCVACVETDDTDHVYISIDLMHIGVLPAVIHEMLHVTLPLRLMFGRDLEEEIVLAFEEGHVKWLNKRPKRLARWHRAIEERIK